MKTTKLTNLVAALTLALGVASCASDEGLKAPASQNDAVVYGSGSKIMNVSLNANGAVSSRAISDGEAAKTIFFEVYKLENAKDAASADNVYVPMATLTVNQFPTNIKLAVEENTYYRIAVWAQSFDKNGDKNDQSNVVPFYLSAAPLTVEVDYTKSNTNNNDAWDAFCVTEIFQWSEAGVNVIMHRPFAQINVGTTYADYQNYVDGAIYPHKTVTKSRISLAGVYNKMDIANDRLIVPEEGKKSVAATFTLANAPFVTYAEDLIVKLNDPTITSIQWNVDETKTDKVEAVDGFFLAKSNYPTILASSKDGLTLNDGAEQQTNYFLTETFKYLSMCYVLVPFSKTEGTGVGSHTSDFEADKYYSSTIGQIDVWFGEDSEIEGGNLHKYLSVKNVPVHRNWRTNLLGGFADPSDPGNPDDETSLFYNLKVCVNLCPIYFGEYYTTEGKPGPESTWVKNEFPTSGPDNLHKEVK